MIINRQPNIVLWNYNGFEDFFSAENTYLAEDITDSQQRVEMHFGIQNVHPP